MPRKTNENKEQKEEKALVAEKPVKKKTAKKTSSSTKKTKTTSKSSATKTTAASVKKGTTSKKTTSKKKVEEKIVEKKKPAKEKTESKTKKTEPKKKTTTKKVATKKTSTKNKAEAPKSKEKAKAKKTEKIEVEVKTKKKKEDVIKEETVIEKIKSFLAKIIAMQEEARAEIEAKKTEKATEVKSVKEENIKAIPYMLEYYDLPYRYNETVVKILAQTPKKLFVYWDIADYDREKYLKAFGEKFFEETYPVLLVHNEDMNYTFEVAVNDFANSWYLDINDSKSKYVIELGRKFKTKSEIKNVIYTEETKNIVLHNDYVPIVSSNVLEVPNDHILFENVQTKILYRNVKDNTETFIDIENNKYTKEMEHIYNIYDLYKEIYKNEIDDESLFDLLNPSSMSSSAFK